MKDNQTDQPPAGRTASRELATAQGKADTVDAARRRRAIRHFLDRHDITAANLAHRAGLPNANAIYNFLSGRTGSLSQGTLERIAAVFPGTSIDELTGRFETSSCSGDHTEVPVVSEAWPGRWRVPVPMPAQPPVVIVPASLLTRAAGDLFAVRVSGPGAERLYQPGAILVCRPFEPTDSRLPAGSRIVVVRERSREVETTIHELVIDGDRAWLWPRSDRPEHQVPLSVPWPLPVVTTGSHGTRIHLKGIVIASWQAEPVASGG